jgi:hypothetical protein
MEADVEALLVNRVDGAREYFLAPIDACFELVGTIRVPWRGLSGWAPGKARGRLGPIRSRLPIDSGSVNVAKP